MEPYQERVIEERAALSRKLDKLKDFLSSGDRAAGDVEQLLARQMAVMAEYLGILDERIVNF